MRISGAAPSSAWAGAGSQELGTDGRSLKDGSGSSQVTGIPLDPATSVRRSTRSLSGGGTVSRNIKIL